MDTKLEPPYVQVWDDNADGEYLGDFPIGDHGEIQLSGLETERLYQLRCRTVYPPGSVPWSAPSEFELGTVDLTYQPLPEVGWSSPQIRRHRRAWRWLTRR